MRIWSLHPQYLDTKGLVALWRETLLAKHVLEGRTKGYKNHPQLDRFKKATDPLSAINYYLSVVYEEAVTRNYRFDREKIDWNFEKNKISVTDGQMQYEAEHLLRKLAVRDMDKYHTLKPLLKLEPHPLFKIRKGDIEAWEIV